jgi:secreted trypsin-like serine protease
MHLPLLGRNLRHRTSLAFLVAVAVVVPTCGAFAQNGSKPLLAAKSRYEKGDDTNTRVVGGDDTRYERNPWQAALVYAPDDNPARAQFCGAVIIHSQWLLTAAHCVDDGTRPEQVDIISGTAVLRRGFGQLRPTGS